MARRRQSYGREKSKDFGHTLEVWREAASLTFKEAATRLGIKCKSPGAYLKMIEKGDRPIPDKVLRNVSNVYNIQPELVLLEAYSPQLPLPFLAEVMKPTVPLKEIEDHLRDLEKQLEAKEKQELARYAAFLMLRRRLS